MGVASLNLVRRFVFLKFMHVAKTSFITQFFLELSKKIDFQIILKMRRGSNSNAFKIWQSDPWYKGYLHTKFHVSSSCSFGGVVSTDGRADGRTDMA